MISPLCRVTRRQPESRYADRENGTAGVVNPRARQRAFAVGVVRDDEHRDDPLDELKELLRTAGVATAGEMTQSRAEPDPDRYLGRGKLAELKREIATADANLVAVDDELLPRQERNLEQELGVPWEDVFASIEAEPLAAGTIGQVHRAGVRGGPAPRIGGYQLRVRVQGQPNGARRVGAQHQPDHRHQHAGRQHQGVVEPQVEIAEARGRRRE